MRIGSSLLDLRALKPFAVCVWFPSRFLLSNSTTIVTVSFNSNTVIRDLLESVQGEARCIVVDNGRSDGISALAAEFGADLLRNEENHGFGRACNAGAALVTSEFIFFVNPDAVIAPGCISALEEAARQRPDLAAANPRVVDAEGRSQFKTTSILLPDGGTRAPLPKTATQVPVLSGCALFVRRSVFEAVGGFDPAIFLYHEDHDLAVRLSRHGSLWCVPDALVRHLQGTGASRTPQLAWFKGYHMARSRHFVLKKHGCPMPFLRTLFPAFGELLLPHNLLSTRRRSRSLGQVMGALSSLGDNGGYKSE